MHGWLVVRVWPHPPTYPSDCADAEPIPAGQGLLLAAISLGHEEAVQLLLAAAPSLAQTPDALAAAVRDALVYAAHQRSAPVALLLAALPDARAAVEALPVPLVITAAGRNSVNLLQQLLDVAPSIATSLSDDYTPAMWAAKQGCWQALAALVDSNPAAATTVNAFDQHALHAAAIGGCMMCIEVLVAAAPHLATAVDDQGWTATLCAARYGQTAALLALLRHAPATALTPASDGSLPIHDAAAHGHTAAVQLLWAAAPHTATAADNRGWQAAHFSAQDEHCDVRRLLLAAAPECALARNGGGWLPAHVAAMHGHAAVLSVLLQACPQAASTRNTDGLLPVDVAVELLDDAAKQPATVRALLPFGDAAAVLRALKGGGPQLAPLFADYVLARLPLNPTIWGMLPSECPGLGRALPAAMQHPLEQAASLVRHLPAADRLRLRTAALCLARQQRRLQCHLPQPVVWEILSLFDA